MPSAKRFFGLLLGLLVISSWIGCVTLDKELNASPPMSSMGENEYQIITNIYVGFDTISCYTLNDGDTVRDAVLRLPEPSERKMKIWILRTDPNDDTKEIILPVDWNSIAMDATSESNYRLLPGDRIHVIENKFRSKITKTTRALRDSISGAIFALCYVLDPPYGGVQLIGYRRTEF